MTCPDCGLELRSPTTRCTCGYDPRSAARPALTEDELAGRDGSPAKRYEVQEAKSRVRELDRRLTVVERQVAAWRSAGCLLVTIWILQAVVTGLLNAR